MTKTILHLTLSGILAVLTGIFVLVAKLLNAAFFSVYPAFSRGVVAAIAGITSVVPIPLWELLTAALAIWFLVSLIRALRRRRMVRWATGVLLVVCIIVSLFVGIWGLNYYAPTMQERLGLSARQYTARELTEAARYYRDRANELAQLVERDAEGAMVDYDFSALASAAGEGFETLAGRMDCFDGSTVRVKKLLSSPLMGKIGTTGVFLCLTGESCVSATTYSASMPFTMCHEIGHRMAFAREDEANFAAFLACDASARPEFRYSGYYMAFLYCYNSLYSVDPQSAAALLSEVSPEMRADWSASSRHYAEIRSEVAAEVSDAVYDTYLKTFSVESGVQSYGEVTDLLLAWYFEKIH